MIIDDHSDDDGDADFCLYHFLLFQSIWQCSIVLLLVSMTMFSIILVAIHDWLASLLPSSWRLASLLPSSRTSRLEFDVIWCFWFGHFISSTFRLWWHLLVRCVQSHWGWYRWNLWAITWLNFLSEISSSHLENLHIHMDSMGNVFNVSWFWG